MSDMYCERKFVFEPLHTIDISVGNTCIIELYDGEDKNPTVAAAGDSTFMEFLSMEKENSCLQIYIKNPDGSDACPIYDREGYQKPNTIRIHTGVADSDVIVRNYLNNMSCICSNIDDNSYKWVCERVSEQEIKNVLGK